MANSAPAARPEDEDTEPDVDAGRIREHVAAHLGRLPTTGINGKIVVSSYGEDPERGRKLIPKIVQFAWPGNDVEALIDEITDKTATLDAEPHRNVYMPYALYRPDLPPGSRGTTADVILVTGIVQDFDAKDDSEAHR